MMLPAGYQIPAGVLDYVTSCVVTDVGVVLFSVIAAGRRHGSRWRRGDVSAWSAETTKLQTLFWILERC